MAPGDLNLKKSWNPALIKNQKKVWEQEQQQLNEFKLIKQRQEELAKEKEQMDLLKLQYGDDLSNLPRDHKLSLNKMNWMYEDGNVKPTNDEQSGFNEVDEEFLLNKRKVEHMLNNNGVALAPTDSSRFEKVMSSSKASSKYSDDPLLKIQQERRKMKARSSDKRSEKDRSRIHKSHNSHKEKSHSHSRSRPKSRDLKSRDVKSLRDI